MKWNWRWFVGGKIMFWISIILLLILSIGFTITYIVNPTEISYMEPLKIDPAPIQNLAEQYVDSMGVTVNHPIKYRFVRYRSKLSDDDVLLGTFHEWNGVYYIDISVDLYKSSQLIDTVLHETRHMLVEYMRDQKIIDLIKYTEEIAYEKNEYYNNLFNSGIYLLKERNNND